MLQSHIELSELSAIEVDGVIIITDNGSYTVRQTQLQTQHDRLADRRHRITELHAVQADDTKLQTHKQR